MCLFCNIDIIAYCGSSCANAPWQADTCPSTTTIAPCILYLLHTTVTAHAGANRPRITLTGHVTLTHKVFLTFAPGRITRSWLRGLQRCVCSQSTGRWRPSHTIRVGRKTAAHIGTSQHWGYTKTQGEDNIQGKNQAAAKKRWLKWLQLVLPSSKTKCYQRSQCTGCAL